MKNAESGNGWVAVLSDDRKGKIDFFDDGTLYFGKVDSEIDLEITNIDVIRELYNTMKTYFEGENK